MMMKQISLAATGFELVTKRTRKREFLGEMTLVVPWAELVGLIEPHAPTGKTGRPPFAVNRPVFKLTPQKLDGYDLADQAELASRYSTGLSPFRPSLMRSLL